MSGAFSSFCYTMFATVVLAANSSWRCHHAVNVDMPLSAKHDIKVVETDAQE